MADSPETIIRVGADTKPAEQAFEDLGERIGGIGKKIGATLAAYLSVRAISAVFDKAIESAMEAERATKAFNAALGMSGQYTAEAAAGFASFASSLEKTTGVEDELILSNAALLVSIGKLSGEGLQRATRAALDLAKGMQIDVGSAFDIVAKATQGNVMALGRYGLEVGKADTDAQKFAKTLAFIETRFAGLSAGNINTFEGALNKLKNGFNDTFESAGLLITKNPKIIATLSVFGDTFYKLSEAIASSQVNLGKFIDGLFNIGKFLLTFVITPIESLVRWMITTTMMIPNLMMTLYTSLASVSDKLFGTDLESKIAPIKQMMIDLQSMAAAPLFTEEQLFSTKISNSLDKTKAKIDEVSSRISTALPAAFRKGAAEAGAAMTEMDNNAKMLATTFKNSLVNVIVKGVDHIAQKIVHAQDVFGGLLSVVLNAFGEMAISIGTVLIGIGIGIESLKALTGFAAVAAGIGLVLIGGIMKALAGGGGGAAPVNPNAAAADSVIAAGDVYTQTKEEERAAAQTGVQVIVQGNIFDSRETGLQIAQIINDSFDLNGTIIRANA